MSERTKPLFATDGPEDGTGRDWHEYFEDYRANQRGRIVAVAADSDTDSDVEPDESAITVVIPAHEVPENWFNIGAPQGLRTWRNRLLANDWTYKCGGAVAWAADSFYKNGNLNQAAHWIDTWWINAIKDGKYITISYTMRDGVVYGARTSRTVRGEMRLVGDKELKAIVEGEDE